MAIESDSKLLIIAFIGILVSATMIGSIADQVFDVTNTITVTNVTTTLPSAANTSLDVVGRELITLIEINNATNGTTLINSGATLQTGFSSNGLRSVQLILNDSGAAGYGGGSVNLSYTAEPDGYVPSSGGRSITILVTLFSALAILIFSIVMLWKGGIQNLIKPKGAR